MKTKTKFQVSANGHVFGVYESDTKQDACNACAVDAGYKNEADMVAQLESPSDLEAVEAYVIVMTQDPYIGDSGDYHAKGYLSSEKEDKETGATVTVTWAALEWAEEIDDESSRCDWSKPKSIIHYSLGDITEKSIVRD